MDWLNYHHLYYFWLVAREGSIAKASERLHLSRPTVSKQLKQLERSLGSPLFRQVGRQLVLTDFGQQVLEYADGIFTLGHELQRAVRGLASEKAARLEVGLLDVLPKLVAYRLLLPARAAVPSVRLTCHEGNREELLAQLAVHRLDLILSDAPVSPGGPVRAYNHFLGECPVTFFGTRELAARLRRRFPSSLHDAPVLLPRPATAVRRELDRWFYENEVRPRVVGEFDDPALMKVFGSQGWGLFPAPSVIEKAVCSQYGVRVVGRLTEVREQYYAVSVERRLRHPAVVAICQTARGELFSS